MLMGRIQGMDAQRGSMLEPRGLGQVVGMRVIHDELCTLSGFGRKSRISSSRRGGGGESGLSLGSGFLRGVTGPCRHSAPEVLHQESESCSRLGCPCLGRDSGHFCRNSINQKESPCPKPTASPAGLLGPREPPVGPTHYSQV